MKNISLFLIILMFIATGCYDVKQTNDSQTNSSEYLQVTTASTTKQLNSDGTIDSTSNQSNTASNTSGTSSSIDINKYVVVNFSDTINTTTVNASSVYILDANQIPIISELIVSGSTISIVPIEFFLPNQTYTIVVTTALHDVGGRTLERTFTFTFVTVDDTVPDEDMTAPSLRYITPANGSTVEKTTSIVMGFDESITGTGFLEVRESGTNSVVSGTITTTDTTLGFMPQNDLTSGSTYTVTLKNSVEDLAGNVYRGLTSWSFSVVTSPVEPPIVTPPPGDTTAPLLLSLTPADGSTVDKLTDIFMTFDESIKGTGILTLRDTTLNNDVVGTSSISGSTLNFTPTNALIAGNDYTVTLENSVEDLSDNVYIGSITSWSFSVTAEVELEVTTVTHSGRTIRVYFSKELDETTVLQSEFLINAGAIIFGQFVLSPSDATLVKFVATEDINGTEDITVSGNVKDIYGVSHNGGITATYPLGYGAP